MIERQHFLCEFLLDGKKRFVIWYSDTTDGLLLDAKGQLASFPSPEQARVYAESQSITIRPQAADVYDFDRMAAWCSQPRAELINCDEFLNVWNMFHDVVLSVGASSEFRAADSRMGDVYGKLFYGNNLPSITPEGERYEPKWCAEEIRALAGIFSVGIQELRVAISV